MTADFGSVLDEGRALYEETLLRDTCRITRPGTGSGSRDPVTGEWRSPEPTTVYEGRCWLTRYRANTGISASSDASATGDVDTLLRRFDVALPFSAPTPVQPGDTLTLTASADKWAVGKSFYVLAVQFNPLEVTRRLMVEDRS